MNNKLLILGTLLFVGNSVASNQDNPWYAGARIGATYYNSFDNNDGINDLKDDKDLGAGIFLGYNFNDWFALETGYTYLGEFDVTDAADTHDNALEVVGKFTWEASESLDLFAKAGAAASFSDGSGGLSGYDDSTINPTVGVGLEHHFTESLSARLEYQLYYGPDLDDKAYDSEWNTHLFALGLVYSWGAPEKIVVEEPPAVEPEPEPVVVVPETITVQQTAEIYFDTDVNSLSASSIEQLKPIIKHLSDYPEATVVVIGHTDNRGTSEYNQQLSEKRAVAVGEYLEKEYSISSERIRTSGAGETDPIASNDTKEGQAENRRVSVFSPSLQVTVDK